jgi:hypothetical protein
MPFPLRVASLQAPTYGSEVADGGPSRCAKCGGRGAAWTVAGGSRNILALAMMANKSFIVAVQRKNGVRRNRNYSLL